MITLRRHIDPLYLILHEVFTSSITAAQNMSPRWTVKCQYITTFIFPISLEKADDVCIRLNNLIKNGQIPKDKIFYKYLDSISYAMIDPNHEYEKQVIKFFNTIKFLGGEKTVNVIRGPMWHGCGSGGVNPDNAKANLGGPGRTTRLKHSSGYSTSSGVIKPWIDSFLKLALDPSVGVKPLVDAPIVKAIGAAMENDGTALKQSIQFDEKQQVNFGLEMTADIEFVKSNPVPKPKFLKENIVTEANVTFLSTTDNGFAMPLLLSLTNPRQVKLT